MKSIYPDLSNCPELLNFIETTKEQLPELQWLKAYAKERLRRDRQCTAMNAKGKRCRAWSVVGDPDNQCVKHGGAKTLAIPKSERFPACCCRAYKFPHRRRSGACNYPEEPLREHPTAQGQRRYIKRQRKAQRERWLKSMGF